MDPTTTRRTTRTTRSPSPVNRRTRSPSPVRTTARASPVRSPGGRLISTSTNESEQLRTLSERVNSLNDRTFVELLNSDIEMKEFLEENVEGVIEREDNIEETKRTMKLSASPEQVDEVLSTGNNKVITTFLASLDDTTLKKFSNTPEVQDVVEDNEALSKRISSIKSPRSSKSDLVATKSLATSLMEQTKKKTASPVKTLRRSSLNGTPSSRMSDGMPSSRVSAPTERVSARGPSPSRSNQGRPLSDRGFLPTVRFSGEPITRRTSPPTSPRNVMASRFSGTQTAASKTMPRASLGQPLSMPLSSNNAPVSPEVLSTIPNGFVSAQALSAKRSQPTKAIGGSMMNSFTAVPQRSVFSNLPGGRESVIETQAVPEEIVLAYDVEKDMQTLLRTPQEEIDEMLNPDLFIEDESTEWIKKIVSSPEYRSARERMQGLSTREKVSNALVKDNSNAFYLQCELLSAPEVKKPQRSVTWSSEGL